MVFLYESQGCMTQAKSLPVLIFTRSIIVSPDLGFSTVMPPLRFPFELYDNLKNILVRPFRFGMWVYTGNATNVVVL